MTNVHKRFSLFGIISGLMVAENLGDVQDELDHLCDLTGIDRFEGGYLEGWTENDWKSVGDENS